MLNASTRSRCSCLSANAPSSERARRTRTTETSRPVQSHARRRSRLAVGWRLAASVRVRALGARGGGHGGHRPRGACPMSRASTREILVVMIALCKRLAESGFRKLQKKLELDDKAESNHPEIKLRAYVHYLI